MVKRKSHTFRPAVAMIELIFALVVMGIVLMSAPALVSTATKSSYIAIQQENINEAATQVNIILTYPWDEANADELDKGKDMTILKTKGATVFDINTSTKPRRSGTPSTSARKSIDKNSTNTLGPDANDTDDIDDFSRASPIHLKSEENVTASGGRKSDYISKTDAININTTVTYMQDTSSDINTKSIITFTPFQDNNTTSNIKQISVKLTTKNGTDELNTSITLHAFSCNLGSYSLKVR